MREWASLMRQYRNADILDRNMLLKLIDRIEVGEVYAVNGKKERKIRIHYKFVGISGEGLVFLPVSCTGDIRTFEWNPCINKNTGHRECVMANIDKY